MLSRTTLVLDPRFPGGTSTAVAQEIYALAPDCDLSVACLETRMFKGDAVHPKIERACLETGTPLFWAGDTMSSDVIVFHNPSGLKFDQEMRCRMNCDKFYVVCHENFLRPAPQGGLGLEGFDVSHCLRLLDQSVLARVRTVAPISANNRKTVAEWFARNPAFGGWRIDPVDWTNICEFDFLPPVPAPQDRRGRHSRPGIEKFTGLEALERIYPADAVSVRLLGADDLLKEQNRPSHWQCLPFGSEPVDQFLSTIDFFVYFTNPLWRESFGRVLAEAMAAGKVVITDPVTASTFGAGALGARPDEVNALIAGFIAHPAAYVEQAKAGQTQLKAFSAAAFRERHRCRIERDCIASHLILETNHAVH